MAELNTDSQGRLLKFDVREDEEQYEKFQEIVETLIGAGYFRARIKGLTDFDKVIGGMTWCIIMCCVDIDIDLKYNENLTIGQKIALTEKIVPALARMKCPYTLEPHQIQGMDCIHIFPVVQWLVKMSIQFRLENAAYMRNFALRMFNKGHNLPIDYVELSGYEEQDMKDQSEKDPLEYRIKALRETLSDYIKRITEVERIREENDNQMESLRTKISSVQSEQQQYEDESRCLEENERQERNKLSLLLHELTKEKNAFHQNCKQEKKRIEKEYQTLSSQLSESGDEDEIEKRITKERSKFRKVSSQLADKIKQVSVLHRKLDDIPTRAELNQYQKRLIELYNQVAAKHNETKKFYILYNQLEDTRVHLDRELVLLDSILNNFNLANADANVNGNQSTRDQFLTQFEQIVENINFAKTKVEKKRQMDKMKKDQLNDEYVDLIEKQRQYYRAVEQLKEEMKKSELSSSN